MVKRILGLILVLMLVAPSLHAEKLLGGVVVDSASKEPMAKVSIKNLTTGEGVLTDYKGRFSINVSNDDYIQFSYLGYKNKVLRISDELNYTNLTIALSFGSKVLQDVTIKRQLTQYQLDSIKRAELYEDVIGHKQEKSVMSPVSSVYQKFSKKYKNIRRLQEQMNKTEEEKFIDTKYEASVVQEITKLKDDSLAFFMNAYPMEYQFARTASELEIRLWIRYNWEDYKTKNKIKD